VATDRVPVPPENLAVGLDATIIVELSGPITAINYAGPNVQQVTIADPQQGSRTLAVPRTTAVLANYPGCHLWQNLIRIPHRSWWTRVSTGSVWFVRADGTMQCETGAGGDVEGMVLSRDDVGGITPLPV
jgi:hypothetical protein